MGSRTGELTGGVARGGMPGAGIGGKNGGGAGAVPGERSERLGSGGVIGSDRPCLAPASFWDVPLRGAANVGAMGWGMAGRVVG